LLAAAGQTAIQSLSTLEPGNEWDEYAGLTNHHSQYLSEVVEIKGIVASEFLVCYTILDEG